MAVHLTHSWRSALGLGWVTSPVFGNDLRVASRRRRSYALRFGYVTILGLLIVIMCGQVLGRYRSGANVQAQMAEAGKFITAVIVWFQFLALPLVAIVVTSTAISEEVNSRTLAVLMTTPLSSRQLVNGKLLGRLSQILFLAATSLPLLAIVRILGGVAWTFLLQGLCITLASTIFAASVSLFFSTLCRRAYTVVLWSVVSIGFLFVVVPFIGFVLLGGDASNRVVDTVFPFTHPGALLARCTEYMLSPRGSRFVSFAWMVPCLLFLLCSAWALRSSSVRLVRQVALRRAMGEPTFLTYLRRTGPGVEPVESARASSTRHIRRVIGPPMIWKELVCSLSRRQRLAATLTVGLEIMLLFIAYTFVAVMAVMGYEGTHLLYVSIFLALAVLFTVVTSATLISTEREARTWPLLLMTPLRDRDILAGKFAGVARRCGPIWLPLMAYVVLFTLAHAFHPLAIPQILALSVSLFFFLGCTGLYLSSRTRRTTTAVTAHVVLIGGLWLVLPIGAFVAANVLDEMGLIQVNPFKVSEDASRFVPFMQGFVLVRTLLDGDPSTFEWAGLRGAWGFLCMVMIVAGSYVLVGLLFVSRAMKAFRRTALDVR